MSFGYIGSMTLNKKKESGQWVVEPLYARPQLVLRRWQIFELPLTHWPRRTRHFVRYTDCTMIEYVSAKILKFDPARAIGCDCAGRHILLAGVPGTVLPQEYASWSVREEVSDTLDMTAEVAQLMAVPSWRQR
jgi:hypothetical protein